MAAQFLKFKCSQELLLKMLAFIRSLMIIKFLFGLNGNDEDADDKTEDLDERCCESGNCEQTVIEIYDEETTHVMPHCFSPYSFEEFEAQIPVPFRKLMYHLYFLWIVHLLLNFFNLCGGVIAKDPQVVVYGCFYMLLSCGYAYVAWYRSAFVAFSEKSSKHFVCFMYSFFLQFAVSAVQSYGITGSGVIGFTWTLERSDKPESVQNLYVVIGLIISASAGCVAVLDFILILMIVNAHDKLQKYFSTGEIDCDGLEQGNQILDDNGNECPILL